MMKIYPPSPGILAAKPFKHTVMQAILFFITLLLAAISPDKLFAQGSISVSGAPAALSTTSGTASSSTNFTISGSSLRPSGILIVTAPPGFDLSADGTHWEALGVQESYVISPGGTLLNTTIYVRLDAGDAVNTYQGNFTINVGGSSITTGDPSACTCGILTSGGVAIVNIPSGTVNSYTLSANTPGVNATTGTWTAPATGGPYLIRIAAVGAQGGGAGSYTGGSGAFMTGYFIVNSGEQLDLTAGAQGGSGTYAGGGGGGSGVYVNGTTNPLIIAGGGGGGNNTNNGGNALTSATGSHTGSAGSGGADGSTNFGSGGGLNSAGEGGGGAGFSGAGGAGFTNSGPAGAAGSGGGGVGGGGGGFVCPGCGGPGIFGGGGGGGYSGGNSGALLGGYGGGSINNGTNQVDTTGVTAGGGYVMITNLGPLPAISYTSPQTYTVGTAISTLTPGNTGGTVAAPGYNNTPVTFGSGFNGPFGVAADAAGNVYVADGGNNAVKKIPAGGGAPVTIGSGFKAPSGVAVDAAGNVYVADTFNGAVKKIPAGGGAPVTIGSGFSEPVGVAVDAAGNVYVVDVNIPVVKEIPAGGGAPVIISPVFGATSGVAVDAAGNVYVADPNGTVVREIPAGGGAPVIIGTGFSEPAGVAVDAAGNVYVADEGNATVTEIPAGGGAAVTIASGFAKPTGVAADAAGNVYVADVSGNKVMKTSPVGGYYIGPFLPAGLRFNNTTGAISGTPTAASPLTPYTVTAYNSQGSGTAPLSITVNYPAPTITNFSPATGPPGTLVTITGTNLNNPTAFTIGGQSAIVVSNTGSVLVAMVMPGAITGGVSLTTAVGTASGGSNFTVTATPYPSAQQGNKLVATGTTGSEDQGWFVSVSADGNTAIVGGINDNSGVGAAWVYTRSGGAWAQQQKLVGSDVAGAASFGRSVSLSADGNTAMVGGPTDNGSVGAAWVFTRSGGVWTQQGFKLVASDFAGVPELGFSVSLSADGNTAIIGGNTDHSGVGAAWIYTRNGGVWAQQGSKLVGSGSSGNSVQGFSVCMSSDGKTAIVGGPGDHLNAGGAWVYTNSGGVWAQQGSELLGAGGIGTPQLGQSVSLSADGNTAIVGGGIDNSSQGAAWVYTRNVGAWNQPGAKLIGSDSSPGSEQGWSVSLSADGNTAIIGGYGDNSFVGAAWVYTRSGGAWTQQGSKLVGSGISGPEAFQGYAVALSADGSTAMVGGPNDSSQLGAAWVFIVNPNTTINSIMAVSSSPTNAATVQYTAKFGAPVTAISASNFSLTTTGAISGASVGNITGLNTNTLTVTVNTGTGDGTIGLNLDNATGMTPGISTPLPFAGAVYTIDKTPPTVSTITATTPANTSPTNATQVSYTVTFSEPVTGVSASDFLLTTTNTPGGTALTTTGISLVSGSGTTYTVTIGGISGDGTLRLDLISSAPGITDAAGNAASAGFTGGDVYTIDNTAPAAVSFTKSDPDPTNETTLHYQLTFSEPVTGVDASNFTVSAEGLTTGTITVSGVSSTVYNITVNNVIGDGTLQVLLNNGFVSIIDLAGNHLSEGATSDIYNVHQNPPAVNAIKAATPSNANPTNATSVTYTVTFTEAVTGVNDGDFAVTTTGTASGAVTNVSGDFAAYTVTVSGISGTGTLRLDLENGTGIQDAAGNAAGGFTGGDTYTIDQTEPTVQSITATTPSNASPTNATSVTYTVTFSEPVTGVDGSDFTVVGTNTVAGVVSNVSGSGSVYTVTVGSVSGDGTLRLDLNTSGDAITDAAGNAVSVGFTGDTYTIDHTPPVVSSITATTPSNATPTNATSVIYKVTFSEPVFGIDDSDFSVTTTGSVSGAVTTIFGGPLVYAVAVDNVSGSGTLRLDLNNVNNIQDAAGNGASGFTGGDVYTIDQTAPTVTIGSPSQSNTTTGPVSYTVTYADANFNTSTLSPSNITLNATGTATGTVGVSGSGTGYTVTISGITGYGSLGISIAAGTASDLAGNLAPAAGPSTPFSISSADATLGSLSTNAGTLSPSFTSGQTTYTETVPNTTTSITIKPTANSTNAKSITVTAGGVTNTVASGSSSPAIALAIGPNIITVKVTAQDGVTIKTYTVTVTRTKSSNANLANLAISPGTLTPGFSPNIFAYSAIVSNTTTSVTVTPTTSDPAATVTVNGTTVQSGKASGSIALAVGNNIIYAVVTAQDGITIRIYGIIVIRAASAIATLSKLTISSGTLTPAFATGTTSYSASVTNTTTSVTVTPTTSDPTATVKVNGTAVKSGSASGSIALAVGKNTITTVVTAQNGTSTDAYTITVTRAASAIATLSKLAISSGTLTPVFATGTTSYTAAVTNATTSITVTPTTSDPTATVKVNGKAVTSGKASGSIALAVGKNTITTVVTAQNGTTTDTYTVTVTRASGPLKSLDMPVSVTKPADIVPIENDGVMVHQGVSPNGDGLNDYLHIDGITAYPDNKLTIIDRSGALIFEAMGYNNISKVFDGHSSVNGKMQQPGTYFYSLDYVADGQSKHKTGFIILKY